MIGYVTLGTNDLERSRAFYDALVGSMGGQRLVQLDHGFTLYGMGMGQPGIAITPPYNGETATAGNGNMIAIVMDERAKVDAFYDKALALGGSCEGKPGLRGPEGPGAFYGAYVRDPEGNKLCAFRIGAA